MTVHLIKVTLRGARPAVWRRLAIPSDLTLADVHRVLQVAMGWTDSHLHRFEHRGIEFGPRGVGEDLDYRDEAAVRLSDLLGRRGDRVIYEYDFGDGWEHELVLESIESGGTARPQAPTVLAGKGACPPEDVGGVGGYAEFLRALNNPRHRDHAAMLEWIGGAFDPAAFDLAGVNRVIGRMRFGRAPGRRVSRPARGAGARKPRRVARRRSTADDLGDVSAELAADPIVESILAKIAGMRPEPFTDEELAALTAVIARELATEQPVAAVELADRVEHLLRRCEFGIVCRRARVGMRVTRRAAAARLGVPESSVQAIESAIEPGFDPALARQYVGFLGLDAWLRDWCRANARLANRLGLSDVG